MALITDIIHGNLIAITGTVFILIVAIVTVLLRKRPGTRHKYYQKKAKKTFKKLNTGELSDGQAINYLRKINPYVFEELVLDAFQAQGYEIKRNKRYSDDGGLDGQVKINGSWRPIQCKRYKNHINIRHVEQFANLCTRKRVKGFFVHTGRTGKFSKEAAYESGYVEIISGSKLITLLRKNK